MLTTMLCLAALQGGTPAVAHTPVPQPLPAATADTSPFRRLELPTPTELREGSGMPGPHYWQQHVDYDIQVTLDTAAQSVSGQETIHYTNHSPDTLRYLWLQLDQNIYRRDSRSSVLNAATARFAGGGFEGGYTIAAFHAVRAQPGGARGQQRMVSLPTVTNGTMLRADLDQPLPPGGDVRLHIVFSFPVPEHGSDRMGREQFPEGWLYEIAEWYPRMAVYDDVRGWNTEQYLGQGEFYLEYGDINFAVTVPRGFVVAGSGTLQNPVEVLTARQRSRLDLARLSDTTVAIITADEVGTAASRPRSPGENLTWRFAAKNVRDVAWAAAPNFIWDASGWNGILMQSFYPPAADPLWRESTKMVRHSIKHYSEKWFHYPYPTAINVNGPVGGMEYPMIVFCRQRNNRAGLYGVTTHELGHEWFPMIVGSNERLYPWMDEGFNTFINIFSTRSYFPEQTAPGGRGEADQWARFSATGRDLPMMLPADRIPGRLLGQIAYNKPATGLYLLRNAILPDTTRFDAAFREYIRRWAFKHPTPADFFRSMEDALGEDLSWFWRGWVYQNDEIDLAVDSVTVQHDSTGILNEVYLSSPGQLPMPVVLTLGYADGTSETVRLPVEVWYLGSHYEWARRSESPLTQVVIDKDDQFPDVRRENNSWQAMSPTGR